MAGVKVHLAREGEIDRRRKLTRRGGSVEKDAAYEIRKNALLRERLMEFFCVRGGSVERRRLRRRRQQRQAAAAAATLLAQRSNHTHRRRRLSNHNSVLLQRYV